MKKNNLLSAFMACAMFTSAANAEHQSSDLKPNERTSALMSFAAMGIMSTVIHKGGEAAGLNVGAKGILHTANVLYNLGQIAEKPVLKDLGLRVLLVGAASKMASSELMKKDLLPNVPFVGASLKQSGEMGIGVITVSTYNMLSYGYELLRDQTKIGKFLGLN